MKRTVRCLSSAAARTEPGLSKEMLERAAKRRNELEDKFNRALDKDGDGNRIRINREKKTVSTPRGNLPISPIMDPEFVEARKRYRQPKEKLRVSLIKSQFRRDLLRNPFAHALATPLRECPITRTNLPNYFHQKLNAVPNPNTNDIWIVPEDMITLEAQELDSVGQGGGAKQDEGTEMAAESGADTEETTTATTKTPPAAPKPAHQKPVISSPVTYVLARKVLLNNIGQKKGSAPHSQTAVLLFIRRDTFLKASRGKLIWRPDMDDVVLENMRRHVVKELLYFLRLYDSTGRDYLLPCPSWESVASMKQVGGACLLWHPSKTDAPADSPETDSAPSAVEQFATFDVRQPDCQRTLPVHDLERLLGPEHLGVLRKHPLFRDNPLLMLGKRRSIPVQLGLWKLQGYLAQYPQDDSFQERRTASYEVRKKRKDSDPEEQ